MILQRWLWRVAGVLAAVEVVTLLVTLSQYEDDTRGGGAGFEKSWAVFEYVGVALIAVTVAAALWTCLRRP